MAMIGCPNATTEGIHERPLTLANLTSRIPGSTSETDTRGPRGPARRDAPVFWYERPHHEPFWAITKHEDIGFISRSPELFSNTQLLRMSDTESIQMGQRGRVRAANRFGGSPEDPPDFIFDPPEHRQHRSLASKHFTPRMMRALEDHFGHMAENYVSHFAYVSLKTSPKAARKRSTPFTSWPSCSSLPSARGCPRKTGIRSSTGPKPWSARRSRVPTPG